MVMSAAFCISAISAVDLTPRQPRTTGLAETVLLDGSARARPSAAKNRAVSSMPIIPPAKRRARNQSAISAVGY